MAPIGIALCGAILYASVIGGLLWVRRSAQPNNNPIDDLIDDVVEAPLADGQDQLPIESTRERQMSR